jgi:hypothetical protein
MTKIKLSNKFSEKQKRIIADRIARAISCFPEFEKIDVLRIERTKREGVLGECYWSSRPRISLAWRENGPNMHTIGHELVHLLRIRKLIDIPASELATDVYATAKSEMFNDDACHYVPYALDIYYYSRALFRSIMVRGIEHYAAYGKRKWCNKLKSDLRTACEAINIGLSEETIFGIINGDVAKTDYIDAKSKLPFEVEIVNMV